MKVQVPAPRVGLRQPPGKPRGQMCLRGLAKVVIFPTQGWQYPPLPGPGILRELSPGCSPSLGPFHKPRVGRQFGLGEISIFWLAPETRPPSSHGHLPPLKRELIEMEDQPASSRGHPSGLTVKCKITITPTEEDPAPLRPAQGLSTAIRISHLVKGPPQHRPGHGTWGDVGHWRQPPPPALPLSAGV